MQLQFEAAAAASKPVSKPRDSCTLLGSTCPPVSTPTTTPLAVSAPIGVPSRSEGAVEPLEPLLQDAAAASNTHQKSSEYPSAVPNVCVLNSTPALISGNSQKSITSTATTALAHVVTAPKSLDRATEQAQVQHQPATAVTTLMLALAISACAQQCSASPTMPKISSTTDSTASGADSTPSVPTVCGATPPCGASGTAEQITTQLYTAADVSDTRMGSEACLQVRKICGCEATPGTTPPYNTSGVSAPHSSSGSAEHFKLQVRAGVADSVSRAASECSPPVPRISGAPTPGSTPAHKVPAFFAPLSIKRNSAHCKPQVQASMIRISGKGTQLASVCPPLRAPTATNSPHPIAIPIATASPHTCSVAAPSSPKDIVELTPPQVNKGIERPHGDLKQPEVDRYSSPFFIVC